MRSPASDTSEAICGRLGLSFPLIQAGMGGVAGPGLAAAVANAGCLGVVALYRHEPDEIRRLLRQTRALTSRPFAVNVIPELHTVTSLRRQIDAVLEAADPGIAFTSFGLAPAEVSDAIRDRDRVLLVQVGTVQEARRAHLAGADALILQGTEAGGHHLGDETLRVLLRDVHALGLGLPLFAAGGIATGAEFARLEALGAAGCMCGTLFVATTEANAHPRFKARIVEAEARDTVVTDTFSLGWPGRRHRVLRNDVVTAGRSLPAAFIATTRVLGKTYLVPRFSVAVPLASTEGMIDHMAMYCGTSCANVSAIRPVADAIEHFRRTTEAKRAALRRAAG
jgi:nitronate monooxygenase